MSVHVQVQFDIRHQAAPVSTLNPKHATSHAGFDSIAPSRSPSRSCASARARRGPPRAKQPSECVCYTVSRFIETHVEQTPTYRWAQRSQTQRCWAKIQSVQSDCLRRPRHGSLALRSPQGCFLYYGLFTRLVWTGLLRNCLNMLNCTLFF